jgi:hypothetical protein
MQCPECEIELPNGSKFCGQCGTKLELVCPNCKASNPTQFKFCLSCGGNLLKPTEATLPKDLSFDEKLAKIQKYLPGGMTQKIPSQRDRRERQRRHVTINEFYGQTEVNNLRMDKTAGMIPVIKADMVRDMSGFGSESATWENVWSNQSAMLV